MEAVDEGGANEERLIIVQRAAGIRTTATVSFFTPASRLTNSQRRDAKLLQVLVRQARKNRLVYVILAEYRLVLPEAQAPQPDHNVHEGARSCGLEHTIVRAALERVRRARRGSESARAARRIRGAVRMRV